MVVGTLVLVLTNGNKTIIDWRVVGVGYGCIWYRDYGPPYMYCYFITQGHTYMYLLTHHNLCIVLENHYQLSKLFDI